MLAPYVDGEVPPDQRMSIDAHLDRCPPCRERVVGERTAHDILAARRETLRACASDTLRARCAAHGRRGAAARLTRRAWVPLSLAATLVLAVAGVFMFGLNDSVEALASQLTLDHVKCLRLPTGAVTDPAEAGRQWASSQGWEIAVPTSSAAEQLEFVCARRCLVTEGRVAHLMYEWRGQPLSVYVLPSPIGRAVETRTFVRRFGHEAVVWSQRGRTYVVLARGKREELDGVVSYVRANAR